jgi:hypothetical protein
VNTAIDIEVEIRRVIATETSAIRLSSVLFAPGGLFNKLHTTPAEKRSVLDSPLFSEANRRLSELQKAERDRLKTSSALSTTLLAVGTIQIEQSITPQTKS